MRISFHHANPHEGNESFLLRFDGGADETPCVLVDAGHGVDLNALLEPTDRLATICLTHAHLDHYSELAAAHRDDVPILTSPATAAILDDVFDVAGEEYGVETTDDVTDAITPIQGWTEVAPGVEVHPVPAGHVPGAVGFLVRVTDGEQSYHLLATGDFTVRRAGGFPGLNAEGFVNIDALFLTGATNDDFEASLTDALGTALEHAHGGAPTLITTSGLVGVHAAYVLSALAAEFGLRVPIRVVGQVAKLYEALDYECRHVETIPTFKDTDECLEPGAIIIAGPEIPTEQSSGRLFGVLKENSNACVVQLIGSGADPLLDGKCTIHDYELVNHPTRETLVAVHDALEPIQTIITHRHDGAQGAFNDLSSVVWGSGDTDEYTLLDGRRWRLPPWMPGRSVPQRPRRSVQHLAGADLLAAFSVPALDRHDEPNLEAEGVDVDRVATLLHQGPDAAASLDVPARDDEQPAERPDSRTDTTMTTDSTDSTDRDEPTTDERPLTGLVRTTGVDFGDELDPALRAALDEGSLTEDDLEAVLTAQERVGQQGIESDDETEEVDEHGSADVTEEGQAEGDAPSQEITEPDVENGDVADAVAEDSSEEAPADGATEAVSETEDTKTTAPEEAAAHETTKPAEGDEPVEDEHNTPSPLDPELRAEESEETVVLELNPLAVALAERAVARTDDDRRPMSIDEAIVGAIDEYVVALLAGEASGTDAERFTIDVNGSEAVERLLTAVVDDDERFASTSELVAEGIASILGSEPKPAREIRIPGTYRRYLDAITANETYILSDVEEIVEAAIAWYANTE